MLMGAILKGGDVGFEVVLKILEMESFMGMEPEQGASKVREIWENYKNN
jgi:hypothetical protein